MAHNIHYIIVSGTDSHNEAQQQVSNLADDYGSEDNYHSIIGSICKEDGSIQISDSSKWGKEWLNIKKIEETIKPLFKYKVPTEKEVLKAMKEKTTGIEYYIIKEYFTYLYNKHNANTTDIWNASYYGWDFDEVGITNNASSDNNKYIVAIDIHS